MSQFSLPLDSAALDRLEDKDLDRVRESAYQDLIEQGRAALVLRDELASRSRVSAQHATHHDDCGCLTARYEARIATLEAALAAAEAFGREVQEDRDRIASAMLRQGGLLAAAEARLTYWYEADGTVTTHAPEVVVERRKAAARQIAAAEAALADERGQLTAALEAERLHADALALRLRDVIASEVGHHAANSDIGLKDHAARRAAEVK